MNLSLSLFHYWVVWTFVISIGGLFLFVLVSKFVFLELAWALFPIPCPKKFGPKSQRPQANQTLMYKKVRPT
jgi:hypothetical protein